MDSKRISYIVLAVLLLVGSYFDIRNNGLSLLTIVYVFASLAMLLDTIANYVKERKS